MRGRDEYFITNDETVMKTPTMKLLDKYYSNGERRATFESSEVVLPNAKTITKAKHVPGFQHKFH